MLSLDDTVKALDQEEEEETHPSKKSNKSKKTKKNCEIFAFHLILISSSIIFRQTHTFPYDCEYIKVCTDTKFPLDASRVCDKDMVMRWICPKGHDFYMCFEHARSFQNYCPYHLGVKIDWRSM